LERNLRSPTQPTPYTSPPRGPNRQTYPNVHTGKETLGFSWGLQYLQASQDAIPDLFCKLNYTYLKGGSNMSTCPPL